MPSLGVAGLRRYACFDFSGGLDLKTPPQALAVEPAQNKLTVATNICYEPQGVTKRPGLRLVTTVDNSATITGLGLIAGIRVEQANGTVFHMVSDDNTRVYRVTNDSSGTATLLGDLAADAISFQQYGDIVLVGTYGAGAFQYDGTSWAALGGSSPALASNLAIFGNRAFATVYGSGATAEQKNTLYYSKLNNVTDWSGTTDAGSIVISQGDLYRLGLTALVPSNQELVLFKENRPFRLQGYGPTTGYTVADHLTPSTGSIGTFSYRGACFAMNDVWYVSARGVHRLKATDAFGDLNEAFVSAPVDPYFTPGSSVYNGDNLYDDLPRAAQQVIWEPQKGLILVGMAGSQYLAPILAYDPSIKAWSVWTMLNSTGVGGMWLSRHRTSLAPEVWMGAGAGSGGNIYALSGLKLSDDASGISATVEHVSALGAPGIQKSPRYLYLYFTEQASSTTISLSVTYDFADTAQFTTTFDIHSSNNESQIVKRIDLPSAACEYMAVKIANATADRTFVWNGYSVDWRPRRALRRAE